jgi:RNA 3'-terminal phosphate cyclase
MKRIKIKSLKGEATTEELEQAMALRLVAKAIHMLQKVGANKEAEELLEEANMCGIHIVIMGDASQN